MMEMIFIKGGSFMMGSPENETGRYDDERQHQAEVSDFCLGKCPVTNAEYRRFKPDHDSGEGFSGDDQPVVWVSWHDATAYAEWLSRETGETYRLPTEAEWEYACRAGTTTRFSCGDTEDELGGFAWLDENSGGTTQSVGQKKPNPWGLHDMHGNVWEWCQDTYCPYGTEPQIDPHGPRIDEYRVLRGGSWFNYDTWDCRAAVRYGRSPVNRFNVLGFRLARTLRP